jgi:lipoprotein-anchoring transpeptidase ErfK/SrfK
VNDLQRLLRDKKLFRGPLTGVYDQQTVYAVAAFHKLLGPAHRDPATARTEWLSDPPPEDWSPDDWDLLEAFRPRPPKAREGQPSRVEIDIGRQVLYLIEHDEVAAIIPVSTGAGTGTRGCTYVGCGASVTPRTDRISGGGRFYTQHNYVGGWSPRPGDWAIYKAIFYRGNYGEWNYGIHGYNQVPHYPASHGCIRTTVWDMDFLRPTGGPARVWLGQTIHVWDA